MSFSQSAPEYKYASLDNKQNVNKARGRVVFENNRKVLCVCAARRAHVVLFASIDGVGGVIYFLARGQLHQWWVEETPVMGWGNQTVVKKESLVSRARSSARVIASTSLFPDKKSISFLPFSRLEKELGNINELVNERVNFS